MYVISYDIVSNRIRVKVANELLNYGRRVQDSVFECDISESRFQVLYEKLTRILSEDDTEVGNILFYRLCKNCEGVMTKLGREKEEAKVAWDDVIII